ncbi:protein disulfide-isomerase, putative [Babesia bigemina]|uniref:Protein disulfide-isomerase, putative n=1 Tax=Babesia bigemina TaxID=5866 RepID=A0A061DB60_BABBI|nr:protein disulfide-isomerase, putative [Babesia bigemina]CDR97773.1 protein disulfide-isomerase, putative [Babesia bigemina]|eukprot:XP_012769959.1 protein disulfide-isomerase, putative [Babesia bigemina]
MNRPVSALLAVAGCIVASVNFVQPVVADLYVPDPPLAEQLTEETYEQFLRSTDKTAIVFSYPSAAVFGPGSTVEIAVVSKILEGNSMCKFGMYQVNLTLSSPVEAMKTSLSYMKDGQLITMPTEPKRVTDIMAWITQQRICEMRLPSVESSRYYLRAIESGHVNTLLFMGEGHHDPELEKKVYDTLLSTGLKSPFMVADRDDIIQYIYRLHTLSEDTMKPVGVMVTRNNLTQHPIKIYWKDLHDVEALTKFFFRELIPPVHGTHSYMLDSVLATNKTMVYIYTKEELIEYVIDVNWLNKFARKHSDRFVFIHSKGDEAVEKRLNQLLIIDSDYVDTAVRAFELHPERGEFVKYKPIDMQDGVITQVKLMNFVNDLRNGKIRHFVKSELAVPENIDVGHVKTIVGEDFHRRVIESDVDVLIVFFSPWCGHCHHAKRVFRDLGRRLKKDKSVMIAKFDAFNNEVEHMSFTEYPTIMLFPHGAKDDPIRYTGDISLQSLALFLENECKKRYINAAEVLQREVHQERLFEEHDEL